MSGVGEPAEEVVLAVRTAEQKIARLQQSGNLDVEQFLLSTGQVCTEFEPFYQTGLCNRG